MLQTNHPDRHPLRLRSDGDEDHVSRASVSALKEDGGRSGSCAELLDDALRVALRFNVSHNASISPLRVSIELITTNLAVLLLMP